jgi:outer membrane biosynthesis protein TonB
LNQKFTNMNAATYAYQEEEEKKNKKRGLLIAFYFHVALIVLGLLPFMGSMMSPDPLPQEDMSYITIDFSQQESSSNVKSPKKKAKKVEKRKKKVEKPVKKEVPQVKPTPAKKILTTPEPEPALETPTETTEVADESVVEEPIIEEAPAEVEEVADPGTGDGEVEESGTASEVGNDTETSSSGNADKGTGFGENAGSGIFNRKVIYRADVKKITHLSGTIVVELCINQRGQVVFAKPDTDASTIKDFSVIRKAVDLTTKYKFAKDYTAPKKQCGKMTYVFEGAGR